MNILALSLNFVLETLKSYSTRKIVWFDIHRHRRKSTEYKTMKIRNKIIWLFFGENAIWGVSMTWPTCRCLNIFSWFCQLWMGLTFFDNVFKLICSVSWYIFSLVSIQIHNFFIWNTSFFCECGLVPKYICTTIWLGI